MKTVMYIVVTLVTLALSAVLLPLGFLFGLIFSLTKKSAAEYIFNFLLAIDQAGNATCSVLFNLIWIKKEGYRFGNPDETISSVLGKNKITDTLTWFGNFVAGLLNAIQKNHVENSIEQ
jgi:hypothetical protein